MKPTDTPNEKSLGKQGNYPRLLTEIKERIRSAQYEALKTVNKELVGLYWDIGRMIVERQADAKHGSAIAEQLSKDLRGEFPGMSGFSRRNIFYMREFYLLYRDDERVQPLVEQWIQSTSEGRLNPNWLHKSAGPTTLSFFSAARTPWNWNFISA